MLPHCGLEAEPKSLSAKYVTVKHEAHHDAASSYRSCVFFDESVTSDRASAACGEQNVVAKPI